MTTDTLLILLVAFSPIAVLGYLAYKTQKQEKAALQALLQSFESTDSLQYPRMRIQYKNFQPPFITNKREAFSYYRFTYCRLIANPHELLIIGLGGWGYNKLMVPVMFVKAHASPHIPVGTHVFICSKIEAKGNDIEIVFYDRMRVPKPITLVIKKVDEPLRKHLLENFS